MPSTERRLDDILRDLDALPPRACVVARQPFHPATPATTVLIDDAEKPLPAWVKQEGYGYFMEVTILLELREGIRMLPSPRDEVALLIHYATHDAWPAEVSG